MVTKEAISSSDTQRERVLIRDAIKRAFDVVFSSVVLILLAPFFGLIALAILRETPGPVFFRGQRIGKRGKAFNILKFRTMYETPESYRGPRVTAHDDPRVTTVGRWLRETKLNELPQFWNVLKGEMSLVGPRPEDPGIAKTWPINVWNEVLSVRPGITSPASVQYHNEEALLNAENVLQKYVEELGPDKMRLDQLYVRYRSFWLDLDTLLWTLLILIPRIGSYPIPETILFVGPVTRLIRRHMSWFSIDLLVTLLVISVTHEIWHIYAPSDVAWSTEVIMVIAFAFIFSVAQAILGVNRISWSKATFADAYDLVPAWVVASVLAYVVNQQIHGFPPGLILIASGLAIGGFVFARYRSRLLTTLYYRLLRSKSRALAARERVLIVGSGRTAEHIAWMLGHPAYSNKFRIVGFVDDDLFAYGTRIYGANVIGEHKDIPQLVEKQDVGLIILADHHIDFQKFCSITHACDASKARVVVAPDIFGSLNSLIGTTPAAPQAGSVRDAQNYRCMHCLARPALSEKETMVEEQGAAKAG